MSAILEQLELNQSFFVQFVIFAVLFFLLSRIYFIPFMRLFEARHKKTVEDREAAEKLMRQAQSQFEDYSRRLAAERAAAKQDYEATLSLARKEESEMLSRAREEAKRLTQEAADSISAQRDQLRKQLEVDVESIARAVSESLLARKV